MSEIIKSLYNGSNFVGDDGKGIRLEGQLNIFEAPSVNGHEVNGNGNGHKALAQVAIRSAIKSQSEQA